jgi:hypothetical protein
MHRRHELDRRPAHLQAVVHDFQHVATLCSGCRCLATRPLTARLAEP